VIAVPDPRRAAARDRDVHVPVTVGVGR